MRTVEERMTRKVITLGAGQTLRDAIALMQRHRVRHLPVMDEGRLVGILSIGDVVKALRDTFEAENRYLRDYIQGVIA